jgi:hypothetical protein
MLDVLSFGAGVQSTTLLCMSCDGVLPKLDCAIFADTQWEPSRVYRHLEWCQDKASKAGIPVIVSTAGNLRQDLIEFWGQRKSSDGKRHASIPAFIKNPDGSRGMVCRQCTGIYKIDVVEKITRVDLLGLSRGQRWPKEQVIRQWIGISSNEFTRRRRSLRPAIGFWYPLLDELTVGDGLLSRGYSRQDCLTWMAKAGYPIPPRSACNGCPFHSDEEWAYMAENEPQDFADAVEVDRLIRQGERSYQDARGELRGEPYLHSSLIPLSQVKFDATQDASEGRGMVNECQGMCGL